MGFVGAVTSFRERGAGEYVVHGPDAHVMVGGRLLAGVAFFEHHLSDAVIAFLHLVAAYCAALDAAAPAGVEGVVLSVAGTVRRPFGRAGLGSCLGVESCGPGEEVLDDAPTLAGLAAFFADAEGGAECLEHVLMDGVCSCVDLALMTEEKELSKKRIARQGNRVLSCLA